MMAFTSWRWRQWQSPRGRRCVGVGAGDALSDLTDRRDVVAVFAFSDPAVATKHAVAVAHTNGWGINTSVGVADLVGGDATAVVRAFDVIAGGARAFDAVEVALAIAVDGAFASDTLARRGVE